MKTDFLSFLFCVPFIGHMECYSGFNKGVRQMKKGLGMITVFLVLAAALCVSGTVMSKGRNDYTRENERYALLEDAFTERAREILEECGFRNSGVTVTWTREQGCSRSYLVKIHHRGIANLGDDERERLTEELRDGELAREAQELCIIYT